MKARGGCAEDVLSLFAENRFVKARGGGLIGTFLVKASFTTPEWSLPNVCPGTHARSECVPLFGLPARRGEALTVAPCGSLYIEGWKMQRGISPGKPFGALWGKIQMTF